MTHKSSKSQLESVAQSEKVSAGYAIYRISIAVIIGIILIEAIQLIPNEIAKQLVGEAIGHDNQLNLMFVLVQIPGLFLVSMLSGYVIAKLAGDRINITLLIVLILIIAREMTLFFYVDYTPDWYFSLHAFTVISSVILGSKIASRVSTNES